MDYFQIAQEIMKPRMRFGREEDGFFVVKMRRNGKWERVGVCNPSAKEAIQEGKLELIRFDAPSSGE